VKTTSLSLLLVWSVLLFRQFYLITSFPDIDLFYTPAHDLSAALALSATGSTFAGAELVARQGIYLSYPAVHIFMQTLGSFTGLSLASIWKWFGLFLQLLQFLLIFLIARRLTGAKWGGAIALAYLLMSDHLLDFGLHLTRQSFSIGLSLSSLYVVLLMNEGTHKEDGLLVVLLSLAVSFSHPLTSIFQVGFLLAMWLSARLMGVQGKRLPVAAVVAAIIGWYVYQSPRYISDYASILTQLFNAFYSGLYEESLVLPLPSSLSLELATFYALKWLGFLVGLVCVLFVVLRRHSTAFRKLKIGWYAVMGVIVLLAYVTLRSAAWGYPGLASVSDVFNRAESFVYIVIAPIVGLVFVRSGLRGVKVAVLMFLLVSGILVAVTSPGTALRTGRRTTVTDHYDSLSTLYDTCVVRFSGRIATADGRLPSSTYVESLYFRRTIPLSGGTASLGESGAPFAVVYVEWEWQLFPAPLNLSHAPWLVTCSNGRGSVYFMPGR
jgi:hypothetical protein